MTSTFRCDDVCSLHDRRQYRECILFADHQLLMAVRHVASDVVLEMTEVKQVLTTQLIIIIMLAKR